MLLVRMDGRLDFPAGRFLFPAQALPANSPHAVRIRQLRRRAYACTCTRMSSQGGTCAGKGDRGVCGALVRPRLTARPAAAPERALARDPVFDFDVYCFPFPGAKDFASPLPAITISDADETVYEYFRVL